MADPAKIRLARRDDLAALTALAIRSKAYWGYDAAFMAACVDELTVNEADLETKRVGLIERSGAPVAMAQVTPEGSRASLGSMFVDPEAIGQGLGRAMFQWGCGQARDMGAQVLEIESDPNAAPFYEAMGASRVGEAPSGSIPGRFLPLYELELG